MGNELRKNKKIDYEGIERKGKLDWKAEITYITQ